VEWIPIASLGSRLPALKRTHAVELRRAAAVFAGAPVAHPLIDVRVSNQQVSVTLAGNIGLGTIFDASATSNEVGYWLEALAYTDQFEQLPPSDGEVVANRFGVGLRIMFRVQVQDSNANLNFAFLGASLDTHYATANYEVQGFGLGVAALPTILDGLNTTGTLTGDSLYELNTTVLTKLTEYIKQNADTLQPQRVAALISTPQPGNSLDVSQAVLYAKRQVSQGSNLQTALEGSGDLDSATIRLVYSDALKTSDPSDVPNAIQGQSADEWLADN
jgi:hypothetical protein